MNFGQTKQIRKTIKRSQLNWYTLETSNPQENNILTTFYMEYEFQK